LRAAPAASSRLAHFLHARRPPPTELTRASRLRRRQCGRSPRGIRRRRRTRRGPRRRRRRSA
jgi:hypothetical protein